MRFGVGTSSSMRGMPRAGRALERRTPGRVRNFFHRRRGRAVRARARRATRFNDSEGVHARAEIALTSGWPSAGSGAASSWLCAHGRHWHWHLHRKVHWVPPRARPSTSGWRRSCTSRCRLQFCCRPPHYDPDAVLRVVGRDSRPLRRSQRCSGDSRCPTGPQPSFSRVHFDR